MSPATVTALRAEKLSGRDFLASFVVFLVALPLCMGIAIASGVPPALGIVTGIIGGLVVGTLSGCPLQVSGPAAGLTVIVWDLVTRFGLPGLGFIVLLAGLLQILAATLRLGRWFQAVSPAVIQGMLAGIGVLIFASQFHVMVDDKPRGSGVQNLLAIPEAVWKALFPLSGDVHHQAAFVGILTIAAIVVWNLYRPRALHMLPAPLFAVVLGTAVTAGLGLQIRFVDVPANLVAALKSPLASVPSLVMDSQIWFAALAVAFIASAETLLCASAVDRMQDGPRTRYDKELFAQGVGNALCGLVGALPMTGVIVRSTANLEAGARTRWSAVLHGAWLLAFVAVLPFVLRLIPVASLAAVLVFTGYKLVNLRTLRNLARYGNAEVGIYLATLVAIVATDLLHGVLFGLGLSFLRLMARFVRLQVDVREVDGHRWELRLQGTASFVTIPRLAEALDRVPDGAELHVHFERLDYVDHACLELLADWELRQERLGGRLVVEWHELEQRFRSAAQDAS
ncbi:MAG: SulP family inorganic anion transporter [Armatimonadetes bacterium]|nr:SulP family inorganic anion transporter [Armatimonadota bacterium]